MTPLIEPALLLALRDGTAHGYDLADQIADHLGLKRIDHGNLYRGLRRLEDEGIVASTWNDGEPGRSKRTYALTGAGEELLDVWAQTLQFTKERLSALLDSYERKP
jgi:poly-beta-hydroxybutyrate-responsive repressor